MVLGGYRSFLLLVATHVALITHDALKSMNCSIAR